MIHFQKSMLLNKTKLIFRGAFQTTVVRLNMLLSEQNRVESVSVIRIVEHDCIPIALAETGLKNSGFLRR